MRESLVGTQDAPLRALTYVVAFLLLVACVNVATLLLARAVSRRREFAIRAALGATRGRHVRQLLAETAVLAIVGCGCGVALAAWVAPLTSGLMPVVLRGQLGLATPALDWRVLAFAIAASLVSAFVAGIVPAFGSWRTSPQAGARRRRTHVESRRAPEPPARCARHRRNRAHARAPRRRGAGDSQLRAPADHAARLRHGPPADDGNELPAANDATGQARGALMRQLVDRVAATPGIRSAALTTVNPLGGGTWGATAISDNRGWSEARAAYAGVRSRTRARRRSRAVVDDEDVEPGAMSRREAVETRLRVVSPVPVENDDEHLRRRPRDSPCTLVTSAEPVGDCKGKYQGEKNAY